MATWLNLINRLERRLRENTSTLNDSTLYSVVLGELINEAKVFIEQQWDWHVLRQDLTATTVASTATADIASSNERSRFYDPRRLVYNDTDDGILRPAPRGLIERQRFIGTTTDAAPIWYELDSITSGGVLTARFYPTPDAAYSIMFPMVVPQATLAADATVLTVPEEPVFQYALLYAIRERGEDMGLTPARQEGKAARALDDAVEMDRQFNDGERVMPLVV